MATEPTPPPPFPAKEREASEGVRLAIIIVSYNTSELLAQCLASIEREMRAWGMGQGGVGLQALIPSPALPIFVTVVDNGSTDGSVAMVADRFRWAEILARRDNLGFAGGNNMALRLLGFRSSVDEAPRFADAFQTSDEAVLTDYVLLLNPDTTVEPGALATLVQFMQTHPEAGVAGARLTYPDGRLQHSAFAFPGLIQTALDLFPLPGRLARVLETRLNGRYPAAWYNGDQPFEVETLLGACLMVRRQAVQTTGLLDEGFFMYAEELDWCRRMRQAGWQLYCVPTAHVVHYEAQSTRQFRSAMFVELWRSRLRLFQKHYRPVRRTLLRTLVWLGATWGRRRASGEQRDAYNQIGRLASQSLTPFPNHKGHKEHEATKGRNR